MNLGSGGVAPRQRPDFIGLRPLFAGVGSLGPTILPRGMNGRRAIASARFASTLISANNSGRSSFIAKVDAVASAAIQP
jgi:hypothetical protein